MLRTAALILLALILAPPAGHAAPHCMGSFTECLAKGQGASVASLPPDRIVTGVRGAIDSSLRAAVSAAAMAAGVPEQIAHAVIKVESGYRPALRGSAGEWGIGQIKCQTAREVGFRGSCRELADAGTNLRFSMAYLHMALAKGGAGCSGVTLYNTGIYARPHCSSYGRRVMARV